MAAASALILPVPLPANPLRGLLWSTRSGLADCVLAKKKKNWLKTQHSFSSCSPISLTLSCSGIVPIPAGHALGFVVFFFSYNIFYYTILGLEW